MLVAVERTRVAVGGAAVMALGSVAELFSGVQAEGAQLEDIAKPLTVEEVKSEGQRRGEGAGGVGGDTDAEAGEAGPAPHPTETAGQRDDAGSADGEDDQVRGLLEARRRQRSGLRRYRPGPGRIPYSPTIGTPPPPLEEVTDTEIRAIGRALGGHGPTERAELAALVGARYWGPGVFRAALAQAVADGRVRRTSRSTYAATHDQRSLSGKDSGP